jgi:DNA (cytosine-5)-methyltransferase 1
VRYVELFAGAGGLSMGLEAAGMVPVAHAEIEPHARAVLRHHWPDTPLHGDVTQVDWTQYAGRVELVAGGSPCQDLSVAGKRAGLDGARSGLFYELIRAWDETGATYCLWENVDGARSSNGGKDFAAVLSAFVGAPVIVPRDGWASAGVVAGSSGVAAWRVLDLQHFGPPQRRRRIFVLAARTGGVDPAQVLALSEGVCGHPSPREEQRQGAARGAAGGAGGGSICTAGYVTHTLTTQSGATEDGTSRGTPIIASAPIGAKPAVLAIDLQQVTSAANRSQPQPVAPTLNQAGNVLAFEPRYYPREQQRQANTTRIESGAASDCAVMDTLTTTYARGMGHNKDGLFVLAGEQSNAGIGIDIAPTMGTTPAGRLWAAEPVHPTLNTTHFGKHFGCNQHVSELGTILPVIGRPRRLTPLECERLMGWPDQHTAHGVKEDGTAYALSDTARYRLCGNGVGTPVAAWIADRLVTLEDTV